jgi:hypothetical protein
MLSDSDQDGQILWRLGEHLFFHDEIKHHEEDRTAEKVLDLPAGRQGGTSYGFNSNVQKPII